MRHQSTIVNSVSLSGRGLHSGSNVEITFHPAPENSGVIFQRIDLPGKPLVRAIIDNVYDTSRGTSIQENGAEVKTVEHLMAALAGLSIDNVLVEINAEETPILDGSAKLYIDVLQKAGIQKQDAEREYITVDKEIRFKKKDLGIELVIKPANSLKMTVNVDYATKVLGAQSATLESMCEFVPNFYEARTFVFLHELQYLIAMNLVKGGDVDNAVVFVENKPEQKILDSLAQFFNKENLDITEQGTLDHNPLRYDNEPARHKLLDLIGDLYLLGKPIKGEIIATKPGHFANTEFAKLIAEEITQEIPVNYKVG